MEEDIVVRRKNENIVSLSDVDDENDAVMGHMENEARKKECDISEERTTANGFRVEINVTNFNHQEPDEYLSVPSNIAKQSMDFESKIETPILKDTITRDEAQLETVSSNISNSIDENTAEAQSHVISSHSSTNISVANDVANKGWLYRKPKKFTTILDSDSEDEAVFSSLVDDKMNLGNDVFQNSLSMSLDSDHLNQKKADKKTEPVYKPRRIVNSESQDEDEDENKPTDQVESSIAQRPEDIGSSPNRIGGNNNILKSNKISALIDSDSEEDNPVTQTFGGSLNEGETMTKLNSSEVKNKGMTEKKKRTGSIRAAKEEAMREIYGESQRMLRESQISLPYHRPKQRTLQEFLNRRKKLPILPTTLPTAVRVKMSSEIVGKALEEKEKEAELFYQSSSDSDTEGATQTEIAETIEQYRPMVVDKDIQNNVENISAIEITQKIMRNDLENGQGIKEVIQQAEKSLGLPRKLFDYPENEAEAVKVQSPMVEYDSEAAARENQGCNQKRKEFKQGLKEVGVPKKLFNPECDEPMEFDHEKATRKYNNNDKINEVQEICEVNNIQVLVLNESNQSIGNSVTDNVHVMMPRGQRNEWLEEEVEDFELKISEEPREMTNDKPGLEHIAISETSTTCAEANITVTTFIDNRNVSKLNGNEGRDLGIIVSDENSPHDDETNSEDIKQLGSAGNKKSISISSESTCNDEDVDDNNKPIGHVFGLPLPEFENEKPKKKNIRILPDIMRLTPKLQGSPDMVIELSTPKLGVDQLIKRFLDHSVTKKTSESSPAVSTMRTEKTATGLKVINEALPYRIPISEKNNDPELSKPGAKLVRLKEDLQYQMAIQRTKEREKKVLKIKTLEAEDIYYDKRSNCGMSEDNDTNEDKEEELSSDGESEPDENDLPIREGKKNFKSRFMDGEAEISEEEDDVEDVEDKEDKEDNDNSLNGDDGYEKNEERETRASQENKPGKLKRIVKAFEDDDSNDSEVKETSVTANEASNDRRFGSNRTDVDIFAPDNNSDDDWLIGTEGDLPVYQMRNDERSQSCVTPLVTNNSLSIVSPITQLTALNTGTELVNRDPISSENSSHFIAPLAVETTPIEVKSYQECNSNKRGRLQKNLFDDVRETPDDTELMGLCSGHFSDSPSDNRRLDRLMHSAGKTDVSDAELLELCSGTFATQPASINKLEAVSQKVQDDLGSSLPSPDESQKRQLQKADTILSKLKIVLSSDDEEDADKSQKRNTEGRNLKKKVRQLELSDEEEESDNESSLSLDNPENGEIKFVDYDSEENEIIVAKRDIKKVATRFLDEEAELSESDWGSADEDERDLDKLDLEEGDLEDIDENQVKHQLEKIHMRQVLDEDQREVRLLQEILLEDGELHSDNASRQRKFKWKNIDELVEDGEEHLSNVDAECVSVDLNEAESELEWRKQRLEREKFLQEQKIKDAAAGVEEETEDSQLIQLGLRALKKTKNTKVLNKDILQSNVADNSQLSVVGHTVADLFASPGRGKKTLALQTAIHRGSFLARGEESLARLSVITKQNTDQAIIRTKKLRNFVFAHLSPANKTPVEGEELKDGTNSDVSHTKLRKRKPPFSLTPLASKKAKKEYQQSNT